MKRLALLIISLALFSSACGGNVFELEVGDCFDDPDALAEVSDVEIVDCTAPHDNEVFHLFDMTESDFPGVEATNTIAETGCLAAFEGYVGRDFESSILNIGLLTPSSESWDQDDREVVCFLYDLNDVQLTGSTKNSGL